MNGGEEKKNASYYNRKLVKWTVILAITTGALAVATFIVAFFAAWGAIDTARLAGAAEKQLRIAYPAQLRVENVEIFAGADGHDVTTFTPDMCFSGFASLINVGRERIANFNWAYCTNDFWWGKNLPMHRDFLARQQQCTKYWLIGEGE